MPDREVCKRCGRHTAARSIEYHDGFPYGRGCLDYCLEREGGRKEGSDPKARVCIICAKTFLFSANVCSANVCCFCCLRGPRYCLDWMRSMYNYQEVRSELVNASKNSSTEGEKAEEEG